MSLQELGERPGGGAAPQPHWRPLGGEAVRVVWNKMYHLNSRIFIHILSMPVHVWFIVWPIQGVYFKWAIIYIL